MPAPTLSINLLPGDELDNAPLGKFLKWALTYGRYIVVITELLVLLAFLSRFKLDRDLSDLSASINSKKNIIQATSQFEDKVRNLQNRLDVVSAQEKATIDWNNNFKIVTAALPQEAQITTIKAAGHAIGLEAVVGSESGLNTIFSNLQNNPKVKSVSVDKITKDKTEDFLTFSLTIDLWP